MESISVNINAGTTQLVYLIHDEVCVWGKGMSFADARKNYKKAKGKTAPKRQTLSVYLCLQRLTEDEAFNEIRLDWVTKTYSTKKVVLLDSTTIK